MIEDWTGFHNPVAEKKALTLLEGIVKENSKSLLLEGDRLSVTRANGSRYFVELKSSKVYNEAGKFVCIRVLSPTLPIIDQVIAKSLYLLFSPNPLAGLDNDLLFKVTIAGLDPNNEWSWVRSFSQTSLGNTFSTLIGADFAVKEVRVKGLAVKLQLWYVNYCSKFESIRTRHIRGSTGAVILWSDHSSNADAKSLQASINELQSCNERRLPMIFVRLYDETPDRTCEEESSLKVEEIARQNSIPFFSCSVDHPATTVKPLACLAEMILERESAKKSILS